MSKYVIEIFTWGYAVKSDDGSLTYSHDRQRAAVFEHPQPAIDIMTRHGWNPEAYVIAPLDESTAKSDNPYSFR